MERMAAIYNSLTTGRGAGEFQGGLDRFGSGIGKEHLVEMRHVAQQALRKNPGKR